MDRSSPRNNFLDILLDPMAIAILGSIAIHAALGAGLPFLTPPNQEGKKAGPGTVKVLELTPSELQRIPQAPPTPTPVPISPAVTPQITQPQPTTPTPAIKPPQAPKFSTAPLTIPFSPIRTTATPTATPKPTAGKKDKKAIAQKQPKPPTFDTNIIFTPTTPAPRPTATPKQNTPKPAATPQGNTTKATPPTTKPSPAVKPPVAKKTPASTTPVTRNDGEPNEGNGSPSQPKTAPAATPKPQTAQPPGTSRPASTPAQTTTQSTTPNGGGDPNGNTESGLYGKYTKAANARLQEYLRKYPNIKQYPPRQLSQQYPPGVPCSKVKQPPFIVLMVAFDRVPDGQDANILGNTTSPLLENEKPYIDGDPATLANKKLTELATTAGFVDATERDKNRAAIDKGKPVLYTYRVQFDPATCKY